MTPNVNDIVDKINDKSACQRIGLPLYVFIFFYFVVSSVELR